LVARNSLEGVPVLSIHLWIAPLFAVFPFFALFPAYPTLMAVQASVLALSVPGAYRLALSTGVSSRNALRWTWFWALHPLVLGPCCGMGEGYQPTIFAITPILWSMTFAREERWKAFYACVFVALACREEVALATLGIGIWVHWVLGKRGQGTTTILISLAWGTVVGLVILPHAATGGEPLMKDVFEFLRMPNEGPPGLVFLRIPFLCFLGFVYAAWGGFTTKGARHLVAAIPMLFALFLVANWGTCNPFYHYAASLSPIFFQAALVESRPEGIVGKRWLFGWIFAAVCLAAWQGKLLHRGLHGADRRSLACLESKIPQDSSLALYSPRGASRFAWGQDLTWMDPSHPLSEFTLIETGRKLPDAWTDTADLREMEAELMAKGAHLIYQAPTVRLWALHEHGRIVCP
jgi:uncharacterized membrane protein